MTEAPAARTPDRRKTRRTLLLIAAVGIAPVLGSTIAYYFFPRASHTNYGTLLAVAPAAEITGTAADGRAFAMSQLKGKWVLLVAAPGACDAACDRELYATRQARTMQNKDQDRVVRVWLVTDDTTPQPGLVAEHPGLMIARAASGGMRALPAGDRAIYLIDPLGNLVLQYPEDPDVKKLAHDLRRLLQASSIG